MSTTGHRTEAAHAASDVAADLREAGFVRLVARPDGDALAATGLLARALSEVGVPFQAGVVPTDGAATRRLEAADGLGLSVGADVGATAVPAGTRPASVTAAEVARALDADPDPVLALAGAFAAGRTPGEGDTARLLETADLARRPGLAAPVDDPADGLAHSTLVHARFSGRPDEAAAIVADAADAVDDLGDEAGRRRVGSLVAVEAAGDEAASDRAGVALERALHPYATPKGPFATVGGYADVLDALARERPGTGVALALGGDVREDALAAWREHATRAHEALRDATTGRYDGLQVARVGDAPVATAARLLAEFRSPEPVAMVVTDGAAAAAATPHGTPPTAALRDAANALDGDAAAAPRGGSATFDAEAREFITAFREAV
jgi:hypothetical protein